MQHWLLLQTGLLNIAVFWKYDAVLFGK